MTKVKYWCEMRNPTFTGCQTSTVLVSAVQFENNQIYNNPTFSIIMIFINYKTF